MNLVNIYNDERIVYLFERDPSGDLIISKDDTYYPYYYEPDPEGTYTSYDGIKLKKIIGANPYDIRKQASGLAYSSDIKYTNNYITDRIPTFDSCPIRVCMYDIENVCDKVPDPMNPKDPISCVTVWDSFTNEFRTFFLMDYQGSLLEQERQLLTDLVAYWKSKQFDVITAYNGDDYDWPLLFNRIKAKLHLNLAKEISPIGRSRFGYHKDVDYPAGTSIVDYMGLFRKVKSKEQSYKLDWILKKYTGAGKKFAKVDFSVLSEDVRGRNREDVVRMVELENSQQLLPYYNEIRMLTKCQWEDLPMKIKKSEGRWIPISNNSKLIDMLLLQEAKDAGVVLPNKPEDSEFNEFEGAFREAFETGFFKGLSKHDLTSAYPFAIMDYCLDTSNIRNTPNENTVNINGINFEQNPKALVPTIVRKVVKLKFDIGDERKQAKKAGDKKLSEVLDVKYAAIKQIVNSAYGTFGNKYFRLYDSRIAGSTTFLVRDLLKFVINKLESDGKKVVYCDTDAVFVQTNDSINDYLNELIQLWGRTNYNKDSVSIEFEFDGIYEKILIIALCRYKGYIRKGDKLEEDITGIEAKRSDSSKYLVRFQNELLDMILDGASRRTVTDWIAQQKVLIKTLPLTDVAFPCKMSNDLESYKSYPVHMRAAANSKTLFNWYPSIGTPFYYIYTTLKRKDDKGKYMDVLGFDDESVDNISKDIIDWDAVIERNITNKIDKIFEAMDWSLPSKYLTNLFD